MNTHTAGKLHVEGCVLLESERMVASCTASYNDGEANAERLALCWNTHEGLVAALEAMLDDDGLANREDARAALAAAKGE